MQSHVSSSVDTHTPLGEVSTRSTLGPFPSGSLWQPMVEQLALPRLNGVNQATICLDGHSPEVMQKDALIWVDAHLNEERYTFEQLSKLSNRFANVLVDQCFIKPGDRVFLFLNRTPELWVSLFGGLKAQAVMGPLFSAFGPDAIEDRLKDSGARVVVTSPSLLPRLQAVWDRLPQLERVILVTDREGWHGPLPERCDGYDTLMAQACDTFDVADTDANTASVMHYTSGTTGKPKGAVHSHQAVIAQAATAQTVLDLKSNDLYWCTADPGWVTGTSYGTFGPWALGVTQLVYAGGFNAQRWYELIDKYQVNVWYTAPTAIRMLMKAGNDVPDLPSLRHLASVGEPLNPEAIIWGREMFGGKTFYDTWWQTETGAMQIVNRPGLEVKIGSMGKPLPGVTAAILDADFNPLPSGEEGHLALRPHAPSMFKGYWQNEEKTLSRFRKGWYLTGDRAKQDEDGYFWFIGREDDVINTAGHLVGPFEVESALVSHEAVAEAGVIGIPDPERMEIIKAFISLKEGFTDSEELRHEITQFVRSQLAAHAYPRAIEIVDSLPKTRSGKIMRRLLKAQELGLPIGDTSTLEH